MILYALDVAAIFFSCHPYIWSTTVLHDTEEMNTFNKSGSLLHVLFVNEI